MRATRGTGALAGGSLAAVAALLLVGELACNHTLPAIGPGGTAGQGVDAAPPADAPVSDVGRPADAVPSDLPPLRVGTDIGFARMRHLTNLEYDNTVRDLLGVPGPARATFPPDQRSGLFDVVGDAQTLTAALYEQYEAAAEALAAQTFADATLSARILTCAPAAPDDDACTRQIVLAFGRRAWRRPLTPDEADALVTLARTALDEGLGFEGEIRRVVTALLSSAPFLMRIELDPNPASLASHRLSAYEQATRLSYLLWSSMPDDHLFALAADGTLLRDDVVTAEVDRMLADPRADGFVEGFAVQWLGGRELASLKIDPAAAPAWDEPLRASMERELRLYFAEFVQKDLDFSTFPSADFNYVDARLARHYGMDTSGRGDTSDRVVSTDDERAGFLGLGAMLTVTSQSARTSPTERGNWILDRLLCMKIPAPPPGSPDAILPTSTVSPPDLARMLLTPATCAACHRVMDGVGASLETFDQLGAVRAQYPDGSLIDTAGWFAGQTFLGEPALATAVGTDGRFLGCVSRQLLGYALNRELLSTDDAFSAQLAQAWQSAPHSLRWLLKTIVVNNIFQFRRGEGVP